VIVNYIDLSRIIFSTLNTVGSVKSVLQQ